MNLQSYHTSDDTPTNSTSTNKKPLIGVVIAIIAIIAIAAAIL